MTLRWKTLLLMSALLSVALLALWAIMRGVLLENFERAEAQQVRYVMVDTRAALDRRGDELGRAFMDWSIWDDLYQYVIDRDARFERSNLTDASLDQMNIDYLGFFDNAARPVFSTSWNHSTHQRAPVWPALQARFQPGDALFRLAAPQSVNRGIISLPQGALQIVALPIHDSNRAGARHGTLIVGHLLTPQLLSYDSESSRNKVALVDLNALPPSLSKRLIQIDKSGLAGDVSSVEVVAPNQNQVAGYQVLRGFYGVPRWALRVTLPRDTMNQGHATVAAFGWILLVTGVIACGLALLPVESLVLRRLSQLSSDVQHLQLQNGARQRVRAQGHDELGHLAYDINATLRALEKADRQRALSQALHQEMAQAVLAAGDCFFVATPPANSFDAALATDKADYGADVTLEWQGNIAHLLGLPADEFPRTLAQWRSYVHPEDWELLRHSYEAAWNHGLPFSLELRVRRADGCELHWQHRGKMLGAQPQGEATSQATSEAQGQATSEADGETENEPRAPAKLLGMCLDITARKVAERARRRTETRLARIAETAADAIMLYDAGGNVIFANAAAARVFGRPIEELWSLSYDDPQWGDAALDGTPISLEETVFRCVERERQPVYDRQYCVRRPNGEVVALSVNATPLPEERGNFGGVVASFSDITGRRQMEERLNHQAFHDPLTGLANRTLINSRLNGALQQKIADEQIAVLFIDLDNFKWVNDSLGHDQGDVLLCEVAARLQKTLRAQDTPARFGGDEFVVLLRGLDDPNYAFSIAERIVTLLSEAFVLSGREVYTSPSIGLAFCEDGSDADTLLRNADAAMYEAKRRGKGRYEVFRDNLSAAALARLEIEGELRRALSAGEMSLAYQPKIELQNGAICGVEALVRWQHPQRGAISPTEFIPVAEATGLVVPLGCWVLREACRQTQQWNQTRETPLAVAVNVSPRQFHSGVAAGRTVVENGGEANSNETNSNEASSSDGFHLQLVRDVAAALQDTGLPPHLLTLEITETVLMERTAESLEVLNALSELGVQLAIDDFGSGYSSLAYLRTFPFDFLKIDREFVSKLDQTHGHSVIVRAIIQLAHTLGLKVIAEGAEVIGEVECLQEFGCDQAQGYFYAKPLPPAELEKLLAAENLIGQ